MRQKKIKQEKGKALRMGFVFLGLVTLFIISSFVSKIIGRAMQSLYDGEHRFTVMFSETPNKNASTLISFSPDTKTIAVLKIVGIEKTDYQKLSVILGLPVDGFVEFSSLQSQHILPLLKKGILKQDINSTNLTNFDFARLWFFTISVPVYQITSREYRLLPPTEALSDTSLDKIIATLFTDSSIMEEKVSIHIINASGVMGLGNRFARILTNSGGNVIAVSTANSILPRSEVGFAGKETYTLSRIARLLGYRAIPLKKQALSDIVVTLGKDKAAQFTPH